MRKTRDLFKKIRDTKGTFHAKMTLKQTVKEKEGSQLIVYTIGSDATPICIDFESICLKTGYQ